MLLLSLSLSLSPPPSPFFPHLQVTPAGFTFAIWGVIFIWQSLWLGYAWTFICRPEAPRTIATGVYPAFAVSSVINISWLYLFGNELINWALGFLVGFDLVIYVTISALAIYFFANMTVASKTDDRLTRVLVLNGLSFYATWTTIAALVNISIVLQYTFNVDATTVGTVILTLLAAVLLIYFSLENTILDQYARDVFAVYPVVIWALIGVVAKHWGKSGEERNSVFALILLLVTVALTFLRGGLLVLFYFFRKREGRVPYKHVQ